MAGDGGRAGAGAVLGGGRGVIRYLTIDRDGWFDEVAGEGVYHLERLGDAEVFIYLDGVQFSLVPRLRWWPWPRLEIRAVPVGDGWGA